MASMTLEIAAPADPNNTVTSVQFASKQSKSIGTTARRTPVPIMTSNPFEIAFHPSQQYVDPLESRDQDNSNHLLSTSSPSCLEFPKMQIPFKNTSSTCASTSTDSEVAHHSEGTNDVDDISALSPSLLSQIFTRRPSLALSRGSTSSQSHDMPLTPNVPITGPCGRPILRRPESTSASASASASEDGNSKLFGSALGLGISPAIYDGEGSRRSRDETFSQKLAKRTSKLTFAVKSPPTHSDLMSPYSNSSPRSPFSKNASTGFYTKVISRSPTRSPRRDNKRADEEDAESDDDVEPEEEDDEAQDGQDIPRAQRIYDQDEESDDDGYQEDSEGGFTSDEDMMASTVFGTHYNRSKWSKPANPTSPTFISSRWGSRSSTRPQIYRSNPSQGAEAVSIAMSTSTSDDGLHDPVRGRKISIATTSRCVERCSRHRSPPPMHKSLPGSPECPPAASSPSAIGLCRRRASASASASTTPATYQYNDAMASRSTLKQTGFISPSDEPLSPLRMASRRPATSEGCETVVQACKSILRKASTPNIQSQSSESPTPVPTPGAMTDHTPRAATPNRSLSAQTPRFA